MRQKQNIKTVIVVTAYGEDNYYRKIYEDLVGIYTSVENAIKGATKDGMTRKQRNYLNRVGAFYALDLALKEHKAGEAQQVNYYEETDGRCKQCESSYMFETVNLN